MRVALTAIVIALGCSGCGPDPRIAELEQRAAAATADRDATAARLAAAQAAIERGRRQLAACDDARQDAAAELERLRAAFTPAQRLAIGRFIVLNEDRQLQTLVAAAAASDPAIPELVARLTSGGLPLARYRELCLRIADAHGEFMASRLFPPHTALLVDRSGLAGADADLARLAGASRDDLAAYRDADFDGKALWRFDRDADGLEHSDMLTVTPAEALRAAR